MRRGVRGANDVTLKHVQTVTRGGQVYRYLRIPGQPRLRLPDLPITDPRFLAAYAAAMESAGQPARPITGTIAAACTVYTRSDRHKALSPDYGRVIERELRAICATAGGKGGRAFLRDLRAAHVRADLAALPANKARARLKAWRLLCGHAVNVGLLADDPTATVSRPKVKATEGHAPWTAPEVEAYRAHWPVASVQRRAMELLFWTGARISDAVRIGPGNVGRDGVLTYRQAKTGQPAHAPLHCALPTFASAADRDHLLRALDHAPPGLTWLVTAAGRTRSPKALGHLISTAARAAGVEKSAHGLRKARAVALAEGGATAHQIGAWTGHATLNEVAHYTAAMDRRTAVMGDSGTGAERFSVNPPAPAVKTSGSH